MQRNTRICLHLAGIFLSLMLAFLTLRAGYASDPASMEKPPAVAEHLESIVLHAADAGPADQLGRYAISADGDTIVVGAYLEDGGDGDPMMTAGAAYVFERNLGGINNWGQAAKLTASDVQAEDRFGETVSIHGDTIVVGADSEDGGPGDPLGSAGAAYVFERNQGGAGNWGEVKKLTASDVKFTDFFGSSVAVYGDTIAVGATGEDGGPGDPVMDSGAVYIFERDSGGPGQWGEVQIVYPGSPEPFGEFGFSVSMDAEGLAVGAWVENEPVEDSGTVYIFERNTEGSGWTQSMRLLSPEPENNGYFGYSVSISGDFLAVGAPNEDGDDGNPFNFAGAAYIFDRHNSGPGAWGLAASLTAPEPNEFGAFGISVAVDGSRAVVGATGILGEGDDAEGAVFLYETALEMPGGWALVDLLRHASIEPFDALGSSVAISGSVIAAGSPGEDGGDGNPISSAGAAIVFYAPIFEMQIFLPLAVRD